MDEVCESHRPMRLSEEVAADEFQTSRSSRIALTDLFSLFILSFMIVAAIVAATFNTAGRGFRGAV